MEGFFTEFDWSGVKITDVFQLTTPQSGTYIKSFGHTDICQFGIKFSGATEIFYNEKKYNYNERTILYLPRERCENIPYNKTILKKGNGVCIFFKSDKPLPDKPVIFKYSTSDIEKLFVKLNDEYNSSHDTFCFDALSTFYKILSVIKESDYKDRKNSDTNTRLEPAKEYIHNHFCDSFIDIETLANVCSMTPEYFRHSFKKVFGMAPHQYITDLKTRKIKELISHPEYSLTEISEMTGFSELNYFSRFFRMQFGISASKYRKTYFDIF